MLFAVLHFDRNAEPPGWLLSMSGTPEQPWMSTHRLGKLGPVRHFVRTVEVAAVLSHTGFAKVSMPLLKLPGSCAFGYADVYSSRRFVSGAAQESLWLQCLTEAGGGSESVCNLTQSPNSCAGEACSILLEVPDAGPR